MLGLSAAVGAALLRDGYGMVAATAAALAIGILTGLVNGVGVAVFHIPSLIFTLGVNGVVRGMIYVYTKGAWVENLPADFTRMSNRILIGNLTVFLCAGSPCDLDWPSYFDENEKGKIFYRSRRSCGWCNLGGNTGR